MIKINFEINNDIMNIFNGYAKVICDRIDSNITLFHKKRERLINKSSGSILSFLIARDFYDYEFKIKNEEGVEITSEQIRDWLALPSNGLFTTITKPPRKNGKKEYKKFYSKYHTMDFYRILISCIGEHQKISKINKKQILIRAFPSYENLIDEFSYTKVEGTHRHDILSTMNIKVCPYCNMNYTFSYAKKGCKKASADIDHFYAKSLYPLYAICLYNFIPSCQYCNSRLKGDKAITQEEYIYPFSNSAFDKMAFNLANVGEVYLDSKRVTPEIILKYFSDDDKVKNSMELFDIEDRYKELGTKARELLYKVKKYNESYQEELGERLQFKESKKVLKDYIFGAELTEEEVINESLGKYKRDLLKQFGIY